MKKLLLALLWLPLVALAQTYPSPTFQNLTVLGSTTLAAGSVSLPSIATQAANTIVANATGALASPTAVAMPSCSASGNALNWTSGTGPTCQTLTAHTFGLGTTDTPTFYGITVNGSTQHGLIVGGGNGNPATYTTAGSAGQPLLSGGASADPVYGTLGVGYGGTGLTSLTQYSTLVGNGTGNVSLIAPGAANYAYLSNGASANPSFQQLTAPMVNYTSSLASATTRTQASKDNDIVSVMDFGADNTCTNDAAPAFRQAAASVNYGGTVLVPWGCYLMSSYTVNNAIIDMTSFPNKGITWQGVGWTLKTGGSFSFGTGTGPQGSIIKLSGSLPSNVDFFHQAPTDLVIGGVGFRDLAIVASTGAYGTPVGRHAIYFDGTAAANGYIENVLIQNVFIDNMATGYSIYVNGVGNNQGVLAGMVIRNSKFMNFYAPNFGDSNTIEKNIVGANATNDARNIGVYWYNVSGATNTRILDNDFVNWNGMIVCDGATKPVISGDEFEQGAGSTNSLGALIYLRGNNGIIDTPTISNNSVSQNVTGQTYTPLIVGNTNGAHVSNNRFSVPSNYNPIQINSNSSYSVVYADNQEWVNGVVQAAVGVTNSGTKNMLLGQAWTSYTPTITASTGTFTTVSGSGAYLLNGKNLSIRLDITITTVGTASGNVQVTLPTGFAAAGYESLSGREINATGKGLSIDVPSASSTLTISAADGTSIIGASYRLILTGQIEIQ